MVQLEGAFYDCMHDLDQVNEDWNRDVLEFYVSYFAQCRRVLDVGCGQGQFIELLSVNGVESVGIDIDSRMIELCRGKGLDIVEADLFDYLGREKEQFDGIFSSNVIEHLSMEDALRFVQMSFDALSPGGVLLIATPNPGSLIVHLHEFWRDATHVRLYDRFLLEFLFTYTGFGDVQSGENPRTAWTPSPQMQAVPGSLECLSSWENLDPWWSFVLESDTNESQRPFWRRLMSTLRRRLARFLVQTVLAEEFATLVAISRRIGRIEQALYDNQERMLLTPREVFAKGVKPRKGLV
jgi:SAM-dependent methyltransferase